MGDSRGRRAGGWTLLELAMVAGIVAVLAAIALPLYGRYAVRASLAQLLVQVDQISTAVQIEDATGVRGLQRDAVPGKAPPGLRNVPDTSFHEPGGLRLLLIRAPAGFFATSPGEERYGLVADLTGTATQQRLYVLAEVLPFEAGDKVWLAPGQLAFPLVQRPSADRPAPPPPDTSWQASAGVRPNGRWDCEATVTAYGTDDRPLTGVDAGIRVRITLQVTTWDGKPVTRGWDDLGRLDGGRATFNARNLGAGSGHGETVTACRMEVTGIEYWWPREPAIPWDGKRADVQVAMPPGAGCKPPCKP